MGGGSSDAAACLKGLNRLWNAGLGNKELIKLAAQLGSDVPFFIMDGAAIGRGRGEILSPLKSQLKGWVAVIKPEFGISTAQAYKALDREKRVPLSRNAIEITASAVKAGRMEGLSIYNDFEAVAFRMHPEIDDIILELRKTGAIQAFMTGSGSAVIGLFKSDATARKAARTISKTRKILGLTCQI